MATSDNEKALSAVYEAFNAKDMDKLMSFATPDAQVTSIPFGATASYREDWEAWARAFPDARIEVKNLIAQGDHVVAEVVGRGTHTGALPGPTGDIPATGRRMEMPLVEIYRFREGKIVEMRYYFDAFSFFDQLGLGAPQRAETRGESPSAQP
jgi:steroid delta-isomerase-like uncharacterized protein